MVRTETGVGESFLLSEKTNKAGLDTPVTYLSTKLGKKSIYNDINHDIFAGPSLSFIHAESVQFFSFDIVNRLRYTSCDIQPYVFVHSGLGHVNKKLSKQATRWNFLIGGGIGLLYKPFFVEYRLWHLSNGSSIFGSPRPNDGCNADLLIIGIEFDI